MIRFSVFTLLLFAVLPTASFASGAKYAGPTPGVCYKGKWKPEMENDMVETIYSNCQMNVIDVSAIKNDFAHSGLYCLRTNTIWSGLDPITAAVMQDDIGLLLNAIKLGGDPDHQTKSNNGYVAFQENGFQKAYKRLFEAKYCR